MSNNEVKRLNRAELLELLLAERKRNEALEQECQRLKEQLADRELRVERAGSLAEAAISVNAVLEAADAAAAQYLENLQHRSEEVERLSKALLERTRVDCHQMLQMAKREAEVILAAANREARKTSAQAEQPDS